MTSHEIDRKIADALLEFANEQNVKEPGLKRFGGVLSRKECEELTAVVRRAIEAADCEICERKAG
jgi:hypothetical protein